MLTLQKMINFVSAGSCVWVADAEPPTRIEKAVTIVTSRVLVLAYAQINLALCHCDLEVKFGV